MPVQKRAYKKQKGRVSRSKKRRTFKVQRFNALQESTLAGGDIVTEEEAPIRPSFVAADSPVNHRASSPSTFDKLGKSGLILLPSNRTLKSYNPRKDSVKQGLSASNMKWMVTSFAEHLEAAGIENDGNGIQNIGGIMIDEIKISDGLVFQGGKLTGIACNLNAPLDDLVELVDREGPSAVCANYVSQLMWTSAGCSYWFPISFYGVRGSFSHAETAEKLEESISVLSTLGFSTGKPSLAVLSL